MPIEKFWHEEGKIEVEEHVCVERNKLTGYEDELDIDRQSKPNKTAWKLSFRSDAFWNCVVSHCPFCGEKLPD